MIPDNCKGFCPKFVCIGEGCESPCDDCPKECKNPEKCKNIVDSSCNECAGKLLCEGRDCVNPD